ncbi:MAG TPA: hemerythrin domain-containing protein [Gallionella sp.]|nr:hemerythrin domain-containing protein [Gallionella sp.]
MISLDSAASAPTFDHPLEMLHACHGKILRQCDTLQKLAAHLAQHGCDTQARQAAQGILRYFDTAGQFHHQDEEENLFPSLRAGDSAPQLDALLQRLLGEHVVMLAAWAELRDMLRQLAEGANVPLSDALLARFIRSYREHIALEEAELLPLAARLLNAAQTRQIGMSMAARRGASFPAPHQPPTS